MSCREFRGPDPGDPGLIPGLCRLACHTACNRSFLQYITYIIVNILTHISMKVYARMANKPWHDINSPGFAFGFQDDDTQPQSAVTDVEPSVERIKERPHVRLIAADSWEEGPNGFAYNEECSLVVNGKFLREETVYKRVIGELFVEYDGEEEDCRYACEGFLDADGLAKLSVKLFFHEKHYRAWRQNPDTPCTYIVRNIRNARGENAIAESAALHMPISKKSTVRFRFEIDPEDEDTKDDTFTLFSTDEDHSYEQSRTIKDDKIGGDAFIDLEFTGLREGLSYSLKADPGAQGKTYFVFEKVSYTELINVS